MAKQNGEDDGADVADADDDDEKEKQINWVLLSCNGGRVTATTSDFYHFYVNAL